MKFIVDFVKRIIIGIGKIDKKILGRWDLDSCNKKINTKIDFSNEDHCGPCGQYILEKTKQNEKLSKIKETLPCIPSKTY
jgi:hypothetical protein